MTSQFLPRGRNGPAWSFSGERLGGGDWPLHRVSAGLVIFRKYAPFEFTIMKSGAMTQQVPAVQGF